MGPSSCRFTKRAAILQSALPQPPPSAYPRAQAGVLRPSGHTISTLACLTEPLLSTAVSCHHAILKHIYRCQLKAVNCTAPPLTASLASCAAPLTAFLASCITLESRIEQQANPTGGTGGNSVSRENDSLCRQLPAEDKDPQEAHVPGQATCGS